MKTEDETRRAAQRSVALGREDKLNNSPAIWEYNSRAAIERVKDMLDGVRKTVSG